MKLCISEWWKNFCRPAAYQWCFLWGLKALCGRLGFKITISPGNSKQSWIEHCDLGHICMPISMGHSHTRTKHRHQILGKRATRDTSRTDINPKPSNPPTSKFRDYKKDSKMHAPGEGRSAILIVWVVPDAPKQTNVLLLSNSFWE